MRKSCKLSWSYPQTRLFKGFDPYDDDEKARIRGEVHRLIAPRDSKYQSNFVEAGPRLPLCF